MAYTTVTLATLQAQLEARWESVPFWSATDAQNALNEALRTWNLLTAQWKRTETIVTAANQVYYPLTSTLVYNLRAQFGSYPMTLSSLDDLDYGKPGWEGHTTTTSGQPTRPTLFTPVGLKNVAIWPADATGNTTLVIDGVRSTPTLVNAGDFVDLGREEHGAILGEALHISAFKEASQRFAATAQFHQQFLQAAAEKNPRIKASTFFRKAMGLDKQRFSTPMKAEAVPMPTR